MCFFILLNTVPCYYKIFKNNAEAQNFGFALHLLGEIQNEKYRYKILECEPNFIKHKRLNGYKLKEMPDILYNRLLGELRNANFQGIG